MHFQPARTNKRLLHQCQLLSFIGLIAFTSQCTGQTSADNQALPVCPDKPNCVSSLATGRHAIDPIMVHGLSTDTIRARLLDWLHKQPGATVTDDGKTVLRAEFRSRIFGFIDDFTLIIEPDGRVDVRSASRTGYYDFGVNRERVEALRAALYATSSEQ